MTDTPPTVAELAAEEAELQFDNFSNDDAWALGTALAESARRQGAPVAIDISRNGHQLFHAALPGRRTTFEEATGLDPRQYAAHGGGYPILVRGVGPVGVVVVSGLPQLDDHRMVVTAIRAHLAR
jgi:uncharacterized protein (UPF0303 family)